MVRMNPKLKSHVKIWADCVLQRKNVMGNSMRIYKRRDWLNYREEAILNGTLFLTGVKTEYLGITSEKPKFENSRLRLFMNSSKKRISFRCDCHTGVFSLIISNLARLSVYTTFLNAWASIKGKPVSFVSKFMSSLVLV